MALRNGPFNLGDRRINRPKRNNALGDEAMTYAGPLVNEPVVVGLYTGKLELRISKSPESFTGGSREGGIKHDAIDAILIHCF
jgi:hypothetical protein